jgi:hypothetical protein
VKKNTWIVEVANAMDSSPQDVRSANGFEQWDHRERSKEKNQKIRKKLKYDAV